MICDKQKIYGKLFFSFLVIFLVLSGVDGVLADSESGRFSPKIGPFLRKSIGEQNEGVSEKPLMPHPTEKKAPGPEFIKVIVIMDRDHLSELPESLTDELKKRVTEFGGRIGKQAYNNVQIWIPVEKIETLAEWSEIKLIKKPFKPQFNNTISEGNNIVGATGWHNNGLTGKGVKVGVIDGGFSGYSSLMGSELPYSTTTNLTGFYNEFYSEKHGTACAEIVHDVAPDAELFLANAGDWDVDFHNAVRWLRSQGIDVISSSIGLNSKIYCGLLYEALHGSLLDFLLAANLMQSFEDTEDQWNATIDDTVSQGIIWSQAAGNDAQKRWKGWFTDSDGDDFLNFSSSVNANEIELPPLFLFGSEVYVLLVWAGDHDDMETTDDYDLAVVDQFGNITDLSAIDQSVFPIGIEVCKFLPIPGIRYFIGVYRNGSASREMVILLGHEDFPSLTYFNPETTVNLSPPADNPNVITVGAVPYHNPYEIEPYSSQGSDHADVIKPDLVAPDVVSTETYGDDSFSGTSAAAPHVAGVCALVKQAHPSYTPAQVKAYLESNATDLGAFGKDGVYGSGLVRLPDPPNDSPATPDTAADVFEDFSDGPGGFWENEYFSVSDGRYGFHGDRTDGSWWMGWSHIPDIDSEDVQPGNESYFENLIVSADVYWQGGADNYAYGLRICIQKNGFGSTDYIRFSITENGHYLIAKEEDGNYEKVKGWTKSSLINGSRQKNNLSIKKVGNYFYFHINEVEVARLVLYGFAGGVGLEADHKVDASFDNFSVVKLPYCKLYDLTTDVFENFSNGSGGFSENDYYSVFDDRYVFRGDDSNMSWFSTWVGGFNPGGSWPQPENSNYFEAFDVSVDTYWEGGSDGWGYGLRVCTQKNRFETTDSVKFLIDERGSYIISKIQDGDFETIKDWTKSSHIGRNGQRNRLSITKEGRHFRFYINYSEVEHFIIDGFSGGGIGITTHHKVDASFDNFRIENLSENDNMTVSTEPDGELVMSSLWIGAFILTEEKGPIEAVWEKGGEDTTAAGDRVLWGYFYASPSDVSWGSRDNPECFVKIWLDHNGRLDVNFFHVSVPRIEIYSDQYPFNNLADEHSILTMATRYVRQWYENGESHSDGNYEDGNPPEGDSPDGTPSGYAIANNLRIGAIISAAEKGHIEAVWNLGGQDTTSRGDQVVWGHFFASPDDVAWGSRNNPELFVKIWFDAGGRTDVNFFHVSVPDIDVYSGLADKETYAQKGTSTTENRYIRHESWQRGRTDH